MSKQSVLLGLCWFLGLPDKSVCSSGGCEVTFRQVGSCCVKAIPITAEGGRRPVASGAASAAPRAALVVAAGTRAERRRWRGRPGGGRPGRTPRPRRAKGAARAAVPRPRPRGGTWAAFPRPFPADLGAAIAAALHHRAASDVVVVTAAGGGRPGTGPGNRGGSPRRRGWRAFAGGSRLGERRACPGPAQLLVVSANLVAQQRRQRPGRKHGGAPRQRTRVRGDTLRKHSMSP
mmetsp:Transcript_121228/g.387329  ORF Transcript_121228/g.387329 Transcript_121228/m.387329 type:complete len:233 (+) Transcript_121228:59-757(+)